MAALLASKRTLRYRYSFSLLNVLCCLLTKDELAREEAERERRGREAAQQAGEEGKAATAGPSNPQPRAQRGPQAAASRRPLHRSTRGQENRQPPNKQALSRSSSAHTAQQQPQPQHMPHTVSCVFRVYMNLYCTCSSQYP